MAAYRAPGRINLVGEHTDYNDGWVMPAAMDLEARVRYSPRAGRRIRLHSAQFPGSAELDLDLELDRPGTRAHAGSVSPHWSRTLLGIARLLDGLQPLAGADLFLDSTVPIGAGMSSSAAAEVAVGFALAAENAIAITPTALAMLCQQASHEYGGTRCGLMDQYIACHGRAGHILELDTATLEGRWHAWPESVALVVCDSGVRHENASSGYNQRRAESEEARALLRAGRPLPPLLARRWRHVQSENERVHAAAAALDHGDFARLGEILNASHLSLRDDYEVSCPELDALAEQCQRQPGVFGARMMGGGFGGSVLAVVEAARAATLRSELGQHRTWLCRLAAGAGVFDGA